MSSGLDAWDEVRAVGDALASFDMREVAGLNELIRGYGGRLRAAQSVVSTDSGRAVGKGELGVRDLYVTEECVACGSGDVEASVVSRRPTVVEVNCPECAATYRVDSEV